MLRKAKGAGSVLHDAAVNWLWSRNAECIWLSTDPGTRAEKFYLDRGWRISRQLENGEVRMELERPAEFEAPEFTASQDR